MTTIRTADPSTRSLPPPLPDNDTPPPENRGDFNLMLKAGAEHGFYICDHTGIVACFSSAGELCAWLEPILRSLDPPAPPIDNDTTIPHGVRPDSAPPPLPPRPGLGQRLFSVVTG